MADTKISDFPTDASISGTEVVPTVQGGVNSKIALSAIDTYLSQTSQTLTNKSIAATQLTGLGTGVATFLATPTSANLASAVTNETGTGLLVFGTNPTFIGSTHNLLSGTELITSWTNNATFPYETFTSSGTTISSAINTTGYGFASGTFSIVSGTRYRVTFTLTLNSGTAPFFGMYTDAVSSGSQKQIICAAGANTFDFVSTRTGTESADFWNDVGITSNYSVASFSCQAVTATTSFNAPLVVSGITSPQNTNSEIFGLGATSKTFGKSAVFGRNASSSAIESVIVGDGATGTAQTTDASATSYGGYPVIVGSQATGNGVAVGYKAQATNYEAVAIGPQTRASGLATVAIGDGARALPSGGNGNEIIIGDVMWATGNNNWLIGGGCGTAFDYVLGLGCGGASISYDKEIATANHQGFLGWYQHDAAAFSGGAGNFNDWWFGGPVFAAAPHAITLNITSIIAGTSNTAGASFTFNGSRGTGTGVGGDIVFKTAKAGSTGSTVNATAEAFKITGTGPAVVFSGGGVTVANLPAAIQGGFAFVTDASTTAVLGLGTTVTGGGANKVPVYSDGTNWIIL